ncbi:MAG: hypothetical protein ABIQ44_12430, partial [Chloroflexia bacterium]
GHAHTLKAGNKDKANKIAPAERSLAIPYTLLRNSRAIVSSTQTQKQQEKGDPIGSPMLYLFYFLC